MANVLDVLVRPALQEIQFLAEGETPTAAVGQMGLDKLNGLLDSWRAKRLLIPSPSVATEWTITPSDGTYTVGTGGDVNVARPVFLNTVRFKDTTPTVPLEYPLDKYNDADYEHMRMKTLTSTLPRVWYYNPTYPLGTLNLWPVPTQSNLKGILYAPGALSEFAALSTTVDLQPGYRRLLVLHLALELAVPLAGQVTPLLTSQADDAMRTVKTSNVRPVELQIEGPGVNNAGVYNIRTGP